MSMIIGYIASILVLGAFSMRTMLPLRMVAVASNFALIAYSVLEQYYLVLGLQLIVLPLNLWRLIEILRLIRSLRGTIDETTVFHALLPFGERIAVRGGELVIRKGDPSDALYLVMGGSLFVQEANAELGPGSIVGEIGVMSSEQLRTATVIAKTDCMLARVSAEEFQRVYYTNPAVGLSLIRLIIDRLTRQLAAAQLANASART
jgi:CRP/FNR family transcriptional regulator, cyclic AMP receptor protein